MFNPETNSDSPFEKSKGVRLVFAKQKINDMIPTKQNEIHTFFLYFKRHRINQNLFTYLEDNKIKETKFIRNYLSDCAYPS